MPSDGKIIRFPRQRRPDPWFGPVELQQQKIVCLACGNTRDFLVRTDKPLLLVARRHHEYAYCLHGVVYLRDNQASEQVVACAVCGSSRLEFETNKQIRTQEPGGSPLPFSPPWRSVQRLWRGVLRPVQQRKGEHVDASESDTRPN